jgi:hypothetical protein
MSDADELRRKIQCVLATIGFIGNYYGLTPEARREINRQRRLLAKLAAELNRLEAGAAGQA